MGTEPGEAMTRATLPYITHPRSPAGSELREPREFAVRANCRAHAKNVTGNQNGRVTLTIALKLL
jgi:hypothetical protein